MRKPTKTLPAKSKALVKSYWAALLWAAFILLLCGLPGYDLPNINFWAIDIEDKLAHVGVFAVLGFLMVYGRVRHHSRNEKPMPGIPFLLFLILAVGYGALTEILQGLIFPSRFADFFDFIADAIGGGLGISLGNFYFHRKSHP